MIRFSNKEETSTPSRGETSTPARGSVGTKRVHTIEQKRVHTIGKEYCITTLLYCCYLLAKGHKQS